MTLLRAREAVMKEFVPSLREQELSAQQWRVIRALQYHGDMDITELCEECHLLKPSMSRIVQNLCSRSIVARRSNKQDKRRTTLALTPVGIDLFHKITPHSIDRYQSITDRFGEEKLDQLYKLLDDLIHSLSE